MDSGRLLHRLHPVQCPLRRHLQAPGKLCGNDCSRKIRAAFNNGKNDSHIYFSSSPLYSTSFAFLQRITDLSAIGCAQFIADEQPVLKSVCGAFGCSNSEVCSESTTELHSFFTILLRNIVFFQCLHSFPFNLFLLAFSALRALHRIARQFQ